MLKLNDYLKFAVSCASKAGKIIKKGFFSEKDVVFKSFANPVTEFDKASEALIVDMIAKKFPSHSILTEEGLSRQKESDVKWVIDPLDGTVNFTHRIPLVCVSIGIEIEGKIKAGVVYNPLWNEWYWALENGGTFLNNKRIFVSQTRDKTKALLVTGYPYESEGRIEYLLDPLRDITRSYTGFRRLGSAAIDMCFVARGSFDGFYEENLKPWDTAAGKIIIEEAGGKLSGYSGDEYNIYKKTIVATNGLLHNDVLELVKNIPNPE